MRLNQVIIGIMLLVALSAEGQPRYRMESINREQLNRGVVAVRDNGRVIISWRTLTSDKKGEPFDIYRNGKKLNAKRLTAGGTFFIDEKPIVNENVVYEVRGGGKDGTYTLLADAPEGYLPIKLQKPDGGTTPDGRPFTYTANDASVADVDGDGQYEIILKWDPTNAHDNAHDGYTGPTLFDCYRLDGTLLWRIDMGINIRSGAHYVPFIVYDLNGDGRAEFIVRTADGTRDSKGNVIGDAQADYRHKGSEESPAPSPQQEWGKYNQKGRPMTGRILTGPDYITVFNGLTGEAMDTKPYVPQRGTPKDWGDDYANRSDRMLAAVGYLDGQRASAIFCRGYYTRSVIAAWDWDGKELKQHWVFDTNEPQWNSYAGQGNHNLRVADVDGDGCDEITYGSMAIDHDGKGLYNTGFGHGDAIHLTAFDPTSDKLQVWDCHENKRDGSDFRDAATGKVIFQIPSKSDVGRAMAADIDPTNPGIEMWSSDSHGIRNIKGKVINNVKDSEDPQHQQHLRLRGRRLSINFGIWWDGDLLRELLDRETVTKYDWESQEMKTIVRLPGIVFNNGTKSNPCLSADILGDWREEVVLYRASDSETCLAIYTTNIPTTYRIPTLMHDHTYRMGVCWQNTAYNQPPHLGYYLPDLKMPSVIDGGRISTKVGESVEQTFHTRNTTAIEQSFYYHDGTRKDGLPEGVTLTINDEEMSFTIQGVFQEAGTYRFVVNLTGTDGYKIPVDIIVVCKAVVEGVGMPVRWDFTHWSDATIQNLLADAAASKLQGWSDVESQATADADGEPTDISRNNCFWACATIIPDENGELSANGMVIQELRGLRFQQPALNRRNLAIAVNYPSTSIGNYHGPSYLWLGGAQKDYFIIPDVQGGTEIKMGIESHKSSEARGVQLFVNEGDDGNPAHGKQLTDANGNTVAVPQSYAEQTWYVDDTSDIIVYNTNGCHIYFIEATLIGHDELSAINEVNFNQEPRQSIYTLSGQRVKRMSRGLYIINGKKMVVR